MNTLEFLKTILPEFGIHYLAIFKDGYQFPAHKVYTDLESMAGAVDSMVNSPQLSAYHACATYQKAVVELDELDARGRNKRRYRVAENWDKARAFWVDVDCGEAKHAEGKGYLTKKDAALALARFSQQVGVPRPMMVDSGYGIHAYWPLSKDIDPTVWRKVAAILKASLVHAGVIADPTRTADFSSILRPVGSINRKGGGAKAVKVLAECAAIDPKDFAQALVSYAKARGVKPAVEAPRRSAPTDLNSDLTAHLPQYPELPVDADLMASKCQQVAAMRDTKGDVDYESWRGVIGLLTYCEDGRKLAKSWSADREETGHGQVSWDVKYDTWTAGPTTCEFFNGCNPAGCEGCPSKGKVKTPLVLGRFAPEPVAIEVEVVDDAGATEQTILPPLPSGFLWDGAVMARIAPDKDGNSVPHPFCENLFYPISRIRGEDGTFRYGIRFHLPDSRVRDFEITGESVASPTDLLRALARYELTKSNHKGAGEHMAAYLLDQLQSLKRNVTETNTMTSFGWKDDHSAFLIGDTLHQKDGTERKVLVGGNAKERAVTFKNGRGSLEKYAEAMNFMYNRPDSVHWQYTICAGWGSLVSHYCEDLYKGLVLALQGGKSGRGKTTACHAALAAFGSPEKMTLNSKEGFTTNALWATLGVFNNIPVLADELTNMEASVFSDVAYGVSNGQDKVRLTSKGGGVVFAKSSEWRLNMYVTGNRDFYGLLAANQANSQAEAVRLIQLNVDRYHAVHLIDRQDFSKSIDGEAAWQAASAMVAAQKIKQMSMNSGHAGAAMVRYILANPQSVQHDMQVMLAKFTEILPNPKFRFYRAHSACTIVIAKIAKKVGAVAFDVKELFRFTANLLRDLADSVHENNTITPEEAFQRMVSVLSPRVIVTTEFRDSRDGRGPETPRNRVNGPISGRYLLGSPSSKDAAGRLMLSQKEVRDWCMAHRIDYHSMISSLKRAGALVSQGEKFVLTRGTDVPSQQTRCIVVDTRKLNGESGTPALTLVGGHLDEELAISV